MNSDAKHTDGIIDNAIIIMGNPVVGKTTLVHAMESSVLVGVEKYRGNVVYKVK